MDLNRLALWFAALAAGSLLWRSARAPRRRLDWVLVSAIVLGVIGAGWALFPESVGYVAAVLTLLLIVLPSYASNAATLASKQARYVRARRLASFAALLHPLREWRASPQLFQAFELGRRGKSAEAEALLQTLARGHGPVAVSAAAHRLRVLGRWREVKALVERNGAASLKSDPTLLAVYVRALGELGFIDDLAEFMLRNEALMIENGSLETGLLTLFAFTGHVELTAHVLGDKRRGYGQEARDYWQALASQYAGKPDEARWAFGRLREATDAQIRARAAERFASLSHAVPEEPPSPQTTLVVNYFGRTLADKQNLILNSPTQRSQRRMTALLVIANIAVYVAGSLPRLIDTRPSFGERWAFFAPDILSGEWWRVFSYLFVHANALHLLMNMGGLWALGPFVERAFGRLRFSLIYLIAGCFGSAVYLCLTWFGRIEPEPLVGASGCIMGLLGATAAVMLRAWIRQRAPAARQIFFRLLAVVALQVAFDYTTPQVAGLAHALGLLGGFIFGLLLHEVVSPKRSVAQVA